MDRRQALKNISIALGGALSSSTISAVLSGCQAGAPGWKPKFLTDEQAELVAALTDLIIPETDTPGAHAAGVHQFIDAMLADWYTPKERDGFMIGLSEIETDGFVSLPQEEQVQHLKAMEASEGSFASIQLAGEKPFFHRLKELTLVGYYTSEIGMTQELKYAPIHSTFDGCVPYADIGKTWAHDSAW